MMIAAFCGVAAAWTWGCITVSATRDQYLNAAPVVAVPLAHRDQQSARSDMPTGKSLAYHQSHSAVRSPLNGREADDRPTALQCRRGRGHMRNLQQRRHSI